MPDEIPNLLTDATTDEMNADFEIMRLNREKRLRAHPPSADEVIVFLGYNAFINHATRPFSPMREVNMLL